MKGINRTYVERKPFPLLDDEPGPFSKSASDPDCA